MTEIFRIAAGAYLAMIGAYATLLAVRVYLVRRSGVYNAEDLKKMIEKYQHNDGTPGRPDSW